jgi:rare lipoprotein A
MLQEKDMIVRNSDQNRLYVSCLGIVYPGIVRVNDRGPFPSEDNAKSGERIIDLSIGVVKKLDFYGKGIARVKVEAIQVNEE